MARLNGLQADTARTADADERDDSTFDRPEDADPPAGDLPVPARRKAPFAGWTIAAGLVVCITSGAVGYTLGVNSPVGTDPDEPDNQAQVLVRDSNGAWVPFESNACTMIVSAEDGTLSGISCANTDEFGAGSEGDSDP